MPTLAPTSLPAGPMPAPGFDRLRIEPDVAALQGVTAGQRLAIPQGLTVEAVENLAAIEADWRRLQSIALATPYQTYDFISAWTSHAARAEGISPAALVLRRAGDGKAALILPLGLHGGAFGRSAVYLGGSHVNLNMPLIDPSLPACGSPEVLTAALAGYARITGTDLFTLRYQPAEWHGLTHPLRALGAIASTDDVRLISIAEGYEAFARQQLSKEARHKLRQKSRKFAESGPLTCVRADEAGQALSFLNQLLAFKAQQFATMGVDDPFAAPGVRTFLAEAAMQGIAGQGGLELHALEVGDTIVAVRAGIRCGAHFSLMVQGYDVTSPLARFSPGDVLLSKMLEESVTRGVNLFDFGLGDGRYKQSWSNGAVSMFDTVLPMTRRGTAMATLSRSRTGLVRFIKRQDRIYDAIKRTRSMVALFKAMAGA